VGRYGLAILVLLLLPASVFASGRVRSENGRFSIECADASLSEILREIAAVTPMELWLDEGLADRKVSVSVAGVTMKQAVERLFRDVKVNYVLYLDAANPEKVAKVYVGGSGGGRFGREPTVSSGDGAGTDVDAPPLPPPALDPESLLQSPEARGVLDELKNFLDQRDAAGESGLDPSETEPGADPQEAGSADGDPYPGLPKDLRELMKTLPPPADGSESPKTGKKRNHAKR
jgi:hypothetical protein